MMPSVDTIGELKRFIDPSAAPVAPLPDFARDPAELVALYRAMVLTPAFDAKAIALQRTGRLGTYASSLGQEAVAVGLAAAMRPEDVLLPSFREHGAQIVRGVTLKELFLYWGGVANAGGVICAAIEYQGGTQIAAFEYIDERIRANTRTVLEDAWRTGTLPRAAALALAERTVRAAAATRRWR
jgi:Dehydrogenase E1 component